MKLREDLLAYRIVGCAMKVHSHLGCGFLESAYSDAMELEFQEQNVPFEREREIRIFYRGKPLATRYRADFFCGGDSCIVEMKAVRCLGEIEKAQTIHYLLATQAVSAVLLNFGAEKLQYEYYSREELMRLRRGLVNSDSSDGSANASPNNPPSVSEGIGSIGVSQ